MTSRTVEVDLVDGMHFESFGEDRVRVDLDSGADTGGQGLGWRPMELMLVALGSCTGMDVLSILRKKRQAVTGYTIRVSGERADTEPHVYTAITVEHVVRGENIAEHAVRHAVDLSEQKYCPAYAMLSKAAPITSSIQILPAAPGD
jgi:putative redox protein